jgi:hypothetical protein
MTFDLLGMAAASVGSILVLVMPPAYGILAVLVVQQMPWAGEIVTLGGVTLRPIDPVVLIWLLRLVGPIRRGNLDFRGLRTAPVVLCGVWLAWLLVATLAAHWREGDAHGGAQLVSLARLYQMALIMPITAMTLSVLRPDQLRRLLWALVIMTVVQAGLAVTRWLPMAFLEYDWIAAFGLPPDHEWFFARNPLLSYSPSRGGRWTGSLGDPATLGYFAIAGLSAAWALSRSALRPARKAIGAALVLTVLSTFTRTAWLGLATLGLAGWMLGRTSTRPAGERRQWSFMLAAGVLAWVVLLGAQRVPTWLRSAPDPAPPAADALPVAAEPPPAAPGPAPEPPPEPAPVEAPVNLASQLRLEVDASAQGRVFMIRLSLDHFAAHPLVGLGWAGRPLHDETLSWGEPMYSRLLAEAGAPGLILFLAFLASCLRSAWRAVKQSAKDAALPASFDFLGVAGFVGILGGDLLLIGPSITSALLFFMAGCAAVRQRVDTTHP